MAQKNGGAVFATTGDPRDGRSRRVQTGAAADISPQEDPDHRCNRLRRHFRLKAARRLLRQLAHVLRHALPGYLEGPTQLPSTGDPGAGRAFWPLSLQPQAHPIQLPSWLVESQRRAWAVGVDSPTRLLRGQPAEIGGCPEFRASRSRRRGCRRARASLHRGHAGLQTRTRHLDHADARPAPRVDRRALGFDVLFLTCLPPWRRPQVLTRRGRLGCAADFAGSFLASARRERRANCFCNPRANRRPSPQITDRAARLPLGQSPEAEG